LGRNVFTFITIIRRGRVYQGHQQTFNSIVHQRHLIYNIRRRFSTRNKVSGLRKIERPDATKVSDLHNRNKWLQDFFHKMKMVWDLMVIYSNALRRDSMMTKWSWSDNSGLYLREHLGKQLL
jgi:hypothetical protein